VTRVEENGSRGPLPEDAAGWMRRFYPGCMLLHEKWGAWAQLLRMDQLIAACTACVDVSGLRRTHCLRTAFVAVEPGQTSVR